MDVTRGVCSHWANSRGVCSHWANSRGVCSHWANSRGVCSHWANSRGVCSHWANSRGICSHWANAECSRNRRSLNLLVSRRTFAIAAVCSVLKHDTKRVQSARLRRECALPAVPLILSGDVHSALGTGYLFPRELYEGNREGRLLYWGPRRMC